jgi:hypothetical protein
MRNRNNGRKHNNNMPNRSHTFESNGPDVKIRGSAQQVLEKYLMLARDAYSSGDRVQSENYFQHAEHYYRVIMANGGGQEQRPHYGPMTPADRDEPQPEDVVVGPQHREMQPQQHQPHQQHPHQQQQHHQHQHHQHQHHQPRSQPNGSGGGNGAGYEDGRTPGPAGPGEPTRQ